MLSLDGFRWDYTTKVHTPNLDYIAANGVKADAMIPSFPTKTFPNHYTLATGLYPDHHGIIQNTFYANDLQAGYSIGNRAAVENGAFYGGEPIWITAREQGMKTASYFWVGSEADVQGLHPDIWKKYEHNFPFESRVDSVIAWLQLPEAIRPQLIMFYFHEPDAVGHHEGPDSPETAQMIMHLDSLVGRFLNQLNRLPIKDQVNFIVVSDHGMGPISSDRVVFFEDYLKPAWVETVLGSNPTYLLQPNPGYIDSVILALSDVEHMQAWKKTEIPERLYYGTNSRIFDVVLVADSAWSLAERRNFSPGRYTGGTHGYDNANADMGAIFYAIGPAFKTGYVQPELPNVNVYNVVAQILGLEPADNDDDFEQMKGMLKDF
ncbi:MAG: ectonucleotide pyrophosphatase/phosphodiesterase [Lentisphaeria bacterium]|nr:ectonucleotide pyrophosphatase/phosphodiesterase [Candidatus Neomarinimicrobiota bacterium]MCF7841414.1 ectonucleotide pyrophosphatase/phosphodiesterase [Lentisphaeria bacterium]